MTNPIRIEAARAAWTRGSSPAYAEDDVIDLLVDIRHLCDSAALDYARCHNRARSHYHHGSGDAS